MPGKLNTLILPKDGSAEDGGGDLLSVCNGVRSRFAGAVCVPDLLLAVLPRPLVFR
jgi:hypothetical protein